jgi:hypothetical protein
MQSHRIAGVSLRSKSIGSADARVRSLQAGLAVEAVLEGVVGYALLAFRGAGPGGFLGVLAISLDHARRHFSSLTGICSSSQICHLSVIRCLLPVSSSGL